MIPALTGRAQEQHPVDKWGVGVHVSAATLTSQGFIGECQASGVGEGFHCPIVSREYVMQCPKSKAHKGRLVIRDLFVLAVIAIESLETLIGWLIAVWALACP